ncbi:hypothetical protein ACXHXG_24095 [Rhizobium sp. LEGMi198b]
MFSSQETTTQSVAGKSYRQRLLTSESILMKKPQGSRLAARKHIRFAMKYRYDQNPSPDGLAKAWNS